MPDAIQLTLAVIGGAAFGVFAYLVGSPASRLALMLFGVWALGRLPLLLDRYIDTGRTLELTSVSVNWLVWSVVAVVVLHALNRYRGRSYV